MSVEPLQPGIGARVVEIWPVPNVVARREITSGAVNRVVSDATFAAITAVLGVIWSWFVRVDQMQRQKPNGDPPSS